MPIANNPVVIANMALMSLGQEPIISFGDDNDRARAVNVLYEPTRDLIFAIHRWNALVKRATLDTPLANSPTWGFTNAFQLPLDYLDFIQLDDLDEDFRIEHGTDGRVLVSDHSSVNIMYLARIDDVGQWSEYLKDVVASRLAAELALKLTGSVPMSRNAWQIYTVKLADAMYRDSLAAPVDKMEGTEWLLARFTEPGVLPFRAISRT